MIYELIYIYIIIYNMEALFMPKYIYFQIICEINLFITWLKGGLKVASKWLKGGLKVGIKGGLKVT